jgi:hypothetical protein
MLKNLTHILRRWPISNIKGSKGPMWFVFTRFFYPTIHYLLSNSNDPAVRVAFVESMVLLNGSLIIAGSSNDCINVRQLSFRYYKELVLQYWETNRELPLC